MSHTFWFVPQILQYLDIVNHQLLWLLMDHFLPKSYKNFARELISMRDIFWGQISMYHAFKVFPQWMSKHYGRRHTLMAPSLFPCCNLQILFDCCNQCYASIFIVVPVQIMQSTLMQNKFHCFLVSVYLKPSLSLLSWDTWCLFFSIFRDKIFAIPFGWYHTLIPPNHPFWVMLMHPALQSTLNCSLA